MLDLLTEILLLRASFTADSGVMGWEGKKGEVEREKSKEGSER